MTEKLFVAIVGGYVETGHVELHDVRFAVGEKIEDCYAEINAQCWAIPERWHLDAWGALEWADGHSVAIADAPDASGKRLWFVNLGGYDPNEFTELHRNVFVVAADEREARRRAVAQVSEWTSPHKDVIADVETAIDVGSTLKGRHIRLTESATEKPFKFEARYMPIGKMAASASSSGS